MNVANKAAFRATYVYPRPTADELVIRTMGKVRSYFQSRTQHRPSPEMYGALTSVAETLAEMAVGQPDATVYLSSLDPGIGKTTVYSRFIDVLVSDPSLEDVGVLILVSRLDEVRSLVEQAAIPSNTLSVMTSDPSLNGHGLVPTDEAQPMIAKTTPIL